MPSISACPEQWPIHSQENFSHHSERVDQHDRSRGSLCRSGSEALKRPKSVWNFLASFLLRRSAHLALVNVTWTLTYELPFYAMFGSLILNRQWRLVLLWFWRGGRCLWPDLAWVDPSHWLLIYYLRPI
jgi:hypothetical protein